MDKNNNEKLKNILLQSVNDEFKDVSDEPPFEASENFRKNMKSLIKEQKHPYLKMCKTKKGKTFIVLVAILILSLSSLSVGAVRETVANVLKAIPSIIMPKEKEKPKKKPTATKATSPKVKKKTNPTTPFYPIATYDEAIRNIEGETTIPTQPSEGTVFENSTPVYESVEMPTAVIVAPSSSQ
ncbi:MAG: hypothetical protein ACI4RL_06455 [Ruminococcus sp.]